MAGSRTERVADQVKELVSQLLSFDVKDPGVGLVTVTHVKVTGDLSLATVYYTLMDDGPRERRETAKALERASPYLRRRVAEDLNLRRATDLRFHYDEHLERQQRVEALLQQIEAERLAQAAAEAPSDAADVAVPPSTPPRDDNPPD
jgi:ribosome-binding factor A